ncbi:MAG: ABC transporter permease subunit [Pseudomonadota bacterium]|nr:ABC transporter permease subunit [Pseudomonadota bacterium]
MRGICTIAWRDFRALTFNSLFFILAGICAFIWTVWYGTFLKDFIKKSQQMMMMQQHDMNLHQVFSMHISTVNLILLFIIPAITMKLFSEEKRANTMDLLLTSPINATQIVLGKFIAGTAAAWVLVGVSFMYPLVTSFYGEVSWGPLFSTYVGLMLLVASYVAIGMFASSLTSSVFLAVIIGVLFNLIFWFVGAGAEIAEDPSWVAVFEHLSLGEHFFKNFAKGIVKITSIVFFLSVIGLNCFLTQRVVESNRWR